jgi:hypothetical protein
VLTQIAEKFEKISDSVEPAWETSVKVKVVEEHISKFRGQAQEVPTIESFQKIVETEVTNRNDKLYITVPLLLSIY